MVLSDAARALIIIQDTYRFSLDDFRTGQFTSDIYSQHPWLTDRYKPTVDQLHLEDMFYLSHVAFESTLYDTALKLLNSTITLYNTSKCLSTGRKEYCIQYNFSPVKEYYIKVHNGILDVSNQSIGENGRVYPHAIDTGNIVRLK